MGLVRFIKRWLQYGVDKLKENTFDSLVWIVNIIPTLMGFSIKNDKVKALVFYLMIKKVHLIRSCVVNGIKMIFLSILKKWLHYGIQRLTENSFDSLLWIVNIIPTLMGFSFKNEKVKAPFFVIHTCLLLYGYGLGIVVFQVKHSLSIVDIIKSSVSASMLVLTANNTYWFIAKRPLLTEILKLSKENDERAKSPRLKRQHESHLFKIKRIIIIFYGFNYTNLILVYIWENSIIDLVKQYSVTPCVGLEPLTQSPNQEICRAILSIQEFSVSVITLNYQSLLLFLIAHTTVMYQLLTEDIKTLYVNDIQFVRQKLHKVLERHTLTLNTIQTLKDLYSMPIGVNFGCNAFCICFFFFLPLYEYFNLSPILFYNLLVFFLYCFLCQRLINAAEEFARQIYCCGWENYHVKEQKLIYIMTIQAQKPIVVLAADIVPVNIYTFATTMQAIYKFVTVLKF